MNRRAKGEKKDSNRKNYQAWLNDLNHLILSMLGKSKFFYELLCVEKQQLSSALEKFGSFE